MVWLDKLKLNKQLMRSVTDAGYLTPKEIQDKALSRINGGQDLIAVGPEGCGKTTTYILGVLMRLKYGVEEAPRALVLVPDKESVIAVAEQFNLLNKNDSIRIVSLYATTGTEAQMNALADGADIVVATPDRARAIYLKLGLNLNKIIMMVVDDADLMVKKGLQLPINELANSITKCQHLIFTEVMHGKLELMISAFMQQPAVIEVEAVGEAQAKTLEQTLYNVPNFRTKLNLLNLLAGDDSASLTIVFVNTRLTAEKVYNSLQLHARGKVAILNPLFFETKGFEFISDFADQAEVKVLLVANEIQGSLDLYGINRIIHFELPEEKEAYISRILVREDDENPSAQAITFATDIELTTVARIEQATGQKMISTELPDNLVIYKEAGEGKPAKASQKHKQEEPLRGEAFHQKKDSNNKDYNFSASKKAKMNKKKNH